MKCAQTEAAPARLHTPFSGQVKQLRLGERFGGEFIALRFLQPKEFYSLAKRPARHTRKKQNSMGKGSREADQGGPWFNCRLHVGKNS